MMGEKRPNEPVPPADRVRRWDGREDPEPVSAERVVGAVYEPARRVHRTRAEDLSRTARTDSGPVTRIAIRHALPRRPQPPRSAPPRLGEAWFDRCPRVRGTWQCANHVDLNAATSSRVSGLSGRPLRVGFDNRWFAALE
jgi:hypothetical protein